MTDMKRRTIVRGTAWTIPVIAVAATAPAFAASQRCKPIAQCKEPGEGQNTKDYAILTNCIGNVDSTVEGVTVDGKVAEYDAATAQYVARGFKDSRAYRTVVLTFKDGSPNETYNVGFPPC
jgi:hypothetical protein